MTAKNVIFGSGIIGLLAKHILGSDWTIIPFGRSRFYSFRPALDDNYIIRDEKIDDFIEHLGGKPKHMYQIRYSVLGEIMPYSSVICDSWLDKVFDGQQPGHASAYLKNRDQFFVYDLRVNHLYEKLQNAHMAEIKTENDLGKITEVGSHYFVRNGVKHEFDNCVSTIPLNALLGLCNINGLALETSNCWVYHIQTNSLDFEGCNQLYVVDPVMSFHKAARIRPDRYLIYCNREITQPGPYFMNFLKEFDIIDGTLIPDGIIKGDRQKPEVTNNLGIQCVGSYAEWDWCADVGSCIMSLLRYKGSLVV